MIDITRLVDFFAGTRKFVAETTGRRPLPRRVVECAAILSLAFCGSLDALGQEPLPPNCGQLRGMNQYGPYDYRTATPEQKSLVEGAHFNNEYSAFLKGQWVFSDRQYHNAPVAGGFDYTLRAFPNHHRVLRAMDVMGDRRKLERLPGATYTVECYFVRSVMFVPDDGLVRALYGAYLAKRGRIERGKEQLALAVKLAPDDVNVRTQVASSYIQMGDLNEAEANARVAYQLGYSLPGLRDSLKAKGHWSE